MAELIQYANGVPGIKWPLDKTIIRIGRADNLNDIPIDDAFASKAHAQIEIIINEDRTGLEYYLRDLQSTNHTYLNRSTVSHTKLAHNDTLMIGKSKFVFLCEGVREYVTLDDLAKYSAERLAQQSEASLSSAVDEITREVRKPDTSRPLTPRYNSVAGRYKFSRRLHLR